MHAATTAAAGADEEYRQRYRAIRAFSEQICRPLEIEDYGLQTSTEASPVKWHLAHTSWYFETFLLQPYLQGYRSPSPAYAQLFNSYYNGVGAQHPRAQRGWLSRPTVSEVYAYRRHVDGAMMELLAGTDLAQAEIRQVAELGLQHEQQHQELMLTDLKYNLSQNPLQPVYRADLNLSRAGASPVLAQWLHQPGGNVEVGGSGQQQFVFDNERPRHLQLLQPFLLAANPVNNAAFMAFIEDDGYRRPELWLADGWTAVQQQGWTAPLYWWREGGEWWQYSLAGAVPVNGADPVAHVSYYEADAYARWRGARLPREAEWELVAAMQPVSGNFVEQDALCPLPPAAPDQLQLYGDVWEWTASPYQPYPGYQPFAGDLGEYNGKFMCNQMVLRGGSCASSATHLRATYRNFFYPADRWQFSGIRLAKDDLQEAQACD